MTEKQKMVIGELGRVYESLHHIWTDELGCALESLGLLPRVELLEAVGICDYIAETGDAAH